MPPPPQPTALAHDARSLPGDDHDRVEGCLAAVETMCTVRSDLHRAMADAHMSLVEARFICRQRHGIDLSCDDILPHPNDDDDNGGAMMTAAAAAGFVRCPADGRMEWVPPGRSCRPSAASAAASSHPLSHTTADCACWNATALGPAPAEVRQAAASFGRVVELVVAAANAQREAVERLNREEGHAEREARPR